MAKWNWHRFKTNAVDDYRPIVFPSPGPWWCTGYGGDDEDSYAVIVCYLPPDQAVETYWPEAYDIDTEEREEIIFTDRFARPEWWQG